MPKRLRQLMTVLFMAGFLIATPLVLLYTAGYTYDWRKHGVEKTGLIETATVPPGATVTLNGQRQTDVTPATFNRLIPDEYRVRFEKDGYLPWETVTDVRSSQTSFVTGVTLLRDVLPSLTIETRIRAGFFSADGRRVAWLSDDAAGRTLEAYDAATGKTVTLARFADEAGGTKPVTGSPVAATASAVNDSGANGSWSTDNKRFLLTMPAAPSKTSASVNAGAAAIHASVYTVSFAAATDATTAPTDTSPNAPDVALGTPTAPATTQPIALDRLVPGASAARWTPDGADLLVTGPTALWLVPADGSTPIRLAPATSLQDATVHDRALYALRTGKDGGAALERRPLTLDAAPTALAVLPPGHYRFLGQDGPYLLAEDDAHDRLLALSPDDGATIDTLSARDARWLPTARDPRLLAWNDFEITISDVRTAAHRLVTRVGTAIGDCAWHPDGNAVFYATEDGIKAIDLDDREPKNVFDLARATGIGGFAVDTQAGTLRFTGAIGNQRGLYERAY